MPSGGCTWRYKTETKTKKQEETKTKTNRPKEEKIQFERLMKICDGKCMIQIIEEKTRGENTLDLIYTNEVGLVTDIDVNKSAISDHHRIEISTNYKLKEERIQQKTGGKNDTMTSLNFHAK